MSLRTKQRIEKCFVNFLKSPYKMHCLLKSDKNWENGLLTSLRLYVRPSVRLFVSMKQLIFHWMGLCECCLNYISKICRYNSTIIKIPQNDGYFKFSSLHICDTIHSVSIKLRIFIYFWQINAESISYF